MNDIWYEDKKYEYKKEEALEKAEKEEQIKNAGIYTEGFEDGYSDGHLDGRLEGYNEGYSDGYSDGYEKAMMK